MKVMTSLIIVHNITLTVLIFTASEVPCDPLFTVMIDAKISKPKLSEQINELMKPEGTKSVDKAVH